jgi:hypothetical protein
MSVPSTREPQKIPVSNHSRTKCFAILAAFDIPKGKAAREFRVG